MDTVFFADLKKITNIKFYCAICDWDGNESELITHSGNDKAMMFVCCPRCLNADIRVFNDEIDDE